MPSFSIRKLGEEVGLISIIKSPLDVKLLCIQRFVRLFAFGAAALILALHMETLGYSDELTGLFMTLTLLGDVVISLVLTMFADRIGRKNVLLGGSLLVTVSGVVFATLSSYWMLLAAAILGVISPGGNEIGPFRAIEESTLSSLAPQDIPNSRSDIFAWYALIGTLGSALGAATSGGMIHELMHNHDFNTEQAYRSVFWLYSALGLVKFTFAACLSPKVELNSSKGKGKDKAATPPSRDPQAGDANDETRPLLEATASPHPPPAPSTQDTIQEDSPPKKQLGILPRISAESRRHLAKLIPLFALDSFASGLVPISWLSPFFYEKYLLSHSALGTLFFSAQLASSASNLLSASLVRRAGLLYTMVFSHLQNDVFLALIPFPPPTMAWLAITFLLLRNATNTIDSAPRSAFIATLLDPAERTAVMGFMNVVRTTAQAGGPLVAGVLKKDHLLWVAFPLAGGLKMIYDLSLLVGFWKYRHNVKDRGTEEEETEGASDEEGRRNK